MNEAQLNAVKGLLHYLNAAPNKPLMRDPGEGSRRLQIASSPEPPHGGLTFDTAIYEGDKLLGAVKHDGTEYRFYAGLGNS